MKVHHFVVACFGLSVFAAAGAHADVTVGGLFSEHMVLQRDVPLPVWGTAEPDEVVTVTVDGRSAAVRADAQGRWQVKLDPLSAAGPHQMVISGQNTITIDDVLVGEVWICSGQSNMAFQVQRALNPEEEIAAADHPRIRLFVVPRHPADEPQTAVNSQWQVCSPETVGSFSAVGYFFGRELHKTMDVPVGLIDSSVGGTPAEAWTPRPALEAEPDFKPIFERLARAIANYKPPQDTAKTQPSGARKKAGKSAARSRPATQPASRSSSRPASRPASRPVVEPRKSPQRPSVLYNGMIHPLIPYAIRGAIWYQGEGNASRAYQYRKLFPAMICNWRQAWGQGDFPFLFVQLANYQFQQHEPYASAWAELREAQLMTLALPATAMAVTVDIGDPKDIHPLNKQEVGRRLALAARAVAYGEKIPYSGPLYEAMAVEGETIRIRFKHTDGGLAARGGEPLKGFAIAGEDRKFVEADAVVDGNTVVVRSKEVAHPVAVRYAWADAPECNLVNGADLPASPFRTDDWPGVTAKEK